MEQDKEIQVFIKDVMSDQAANAQEKLDKIIKAKCANKIASTLNS